MPGEFPGERAYIGLGANLGNKSRSIAEAARLLEGEGLRVVRLSRLWLTEPLEGTGPEWFVNAAAEVATRLDPWQLLARCQEVEARIGRLRLPGTRAREIDLDLLLHGASLVEEPRLTVPHPRLHLRRFVLQPLCELAPGLVHPRLELPLTRLLESCPDTSLTLPIP
jgi:2-amino-4-hydroxy-6-hydroxymethyldihydropteridine diphosphokinase